MWKERIFLLVTILFHYLCMYIHMYVCKYFIAVLGIHCAIYKSPYSHMLVAQTCNPSYSGGTDQEDCGSKPVPANSSQDPISKKPITKKGWWSDAGCRP
jgi:hypothetical protein